MIASITNILYPKEKYSINPVQLISIQNNKLLCSNDEKLINNYKNAKIISIIGNGRTGKSSFLNCIASYLENVNINIFDIQDTDEHCTHGIDMFYIEKHDLILLDCQGLKLNDSSDDPKLLLMIYLLSDCIIYNQKSILNNDIFETLQPLASFMNYLENINNFNQKPSLFFRLCDVDLNFEPEVHLKKTLSKKKDQYQNIREAITTLFSCCAIGTTEMLDRNEKKELKNKNFYKILKNTENNFETSIKKLLDLINNIKNVRKISSWYNNIKLFVESINDNKKIDFNKLDIYCLLIEKEMLEFENNISHEHYSNLSAFATQYNFDKYIQPQIDFVKNCLLQFEKKFKFVGSEIYSKYYEKLSVKLNCPINKAIKETELLANTAINDLLNAEIKVSFEEDIMDKNTFENNTKNIIQKILLKYENFKLLINIYYKPVYQQYVNKFAEYIDKLEKQLIEISSKEIKDIEQTDKDFIIIYKNFSILLDKFLKCDIKNSIFSCLFNETLEYKYLDDFILNFYNVYWIKYWNINSDIKFDNITEYINSHNISNHIIYSYNTGNIIITTFNSKYLEYYIKNKMKIIYELFFSKEIKKICLIKLQQNNIIIIDKYLQKNLNILNNITSDDKIANIIIKYKNDEQICLEDLTYIKQLIKTYINEHYIGFNKNLNNYLIDFTHIKKNLYLQEFKKYLDKKYNKKFQYDKSVICNTLLINNNYGNKDKMLKNIYNEFKLNYTLQNFGLEPFITIKKIENQSN
jgi:hypothetical protein